MDTDGGGLFYCKHANLALFTCVFIQIAAILTELGHWHID